ncbi:MAG: double-strand break repair protein AddB [Rhizomicrobium sp.]
MPAHVLTIASSAPFAETLARGLLSRVDIEENPLALAETTIYLPTRRAVRTLADTFARVLGGAALLPDIRPLGDVDEDEFLFAPMDGDLALPPAIDPLRRRFLLAALVQHWHEKTRSTPLGFAQAASLARGLASFLDEVQRQGADLSRLDTMVDAPLADHWEQVREFLIIVRDKWPAVLAAEGKLNPVDRRNQAIRALAQRYEQKPPTGPVIAAGSTGSIPATAQLLRVIANLPNGSAILPGLDRVLDEKSWAALDANHPQYGMRELLASLGVARQDVAEWQPAPASLPARENLLRQTLRPAPTTDAWRDIAEHGSDEIARGLDGLSLIEAANPGEEALAIALILRKALEEPGQTAALVTPDRNLARRVAAEMLRWDIAIDDSAGRPLSKTPPGAFLLLLADAAESAFAPVPLLALLKHPLAAGGENDATFRARVRELDRLVLRGPRPDAGLDGVASAIARAAQRERLSERDRKDILALAPWFARVAEILKPFEDALAAPAISIGDLADVHMKVAEALGATSGESGALQLWRGDAGEAAANLFAELHEADSALPPIEPRAWPALLRDLADERPIRPAFGRHPRLAILGPLEARLQSFDIVVLGGLNEGTWPRAPSADPWLSRPMRQKLGLERPERAIGLAAHDFAALAAGPRVFLTRALKVDGTPAVASRWLQRLEQLCEGLKLTAHLADKANYAGCSAMLDAPEGPPKRMDRPQPRPPVEKRPKGLSVTEIETWMRDPYAIYAKHVLRLRPLDPLDAGVGPLERGTAVHAALEKFLIACGDAWPADAEDKLIAIGRELLGDVPKATQAIWLPRFEQAARWFVRMEGERRDTVSRSFLEQAGARVFAVGGNTFTLRGRADRIDVLKGGAAAIIDYKTGNPPSPAQVRLLWAPQLPLEGAMLKEGGFETIGKLAACELLYIKFSGGTPPGRVQSVPEDIPSLIARAEATLLLLIAHYSEQSTPYLSRVMPFRADIAGDYDHLARVREWSLSGWESSDDE